MIDPKVIRAAFEADNRNSVWTDEEYQAQVNCGFTDYLIPILEAAFAAEKAHA